MTLWAGTRGQSLVEFALLLPVLLLIMLGIFEGGRLIYCYQTLGHAAREGVHQAELANASRAQIEAAINANSGLLGNVGSNALISPSSTPRTPGQPVTVSVSYTFRTVAPLLSQLAQVDLTSTEVVTVE